MDQDNKVSWYTSQTYTQDPNTSIANNQVLRQRDTVANMLSALAKDDGLLGANTDSIFREFQSDPALFEKAANNQLTLWMSNKASAKELEVAATEFGEDAPLRIAQNYLQNTINTAAYAEQNVRSAIAAKLVEQANKTGQFFSDPSRFSNSEIDAQRLNTKLLEDKALFDQTLNSSLDEFKVQMEQRHNDGTSFNRDPKQAAFLYKIFVEGGSEALTRAVNAINEEDSERRQRRVQGFSDIYGNELWQSAVEFSDGIDVVKYNPTEIDNSDNAFTRKVRSGELNLAKKVDDTYVDFTSLEGFSQITEKITGDDYMYNEFGRKYTEEVLDIASRISKGDESVGYTMRDLYQTIINWSASKGDFKTGEVGKGADDVYKFNYFKAPNEVQLAFDILAATGTTEDIRVFGDGTYGITPSRLERVQKDGAYINPGAMNNTAQGMSLGGSVGAAFVKGAVDGVVLTTAMMGARLFGFHEKAEQLRDQVDFGAGQSGNSSIDALNNISLMAGNMAGVGAEMFYGGKGIISGVNKLSQLPKVAKSSKLAKQSADLATAGVKIEQAVDAGVQAQRQAALASKLPSRFAKYNGALRQLGDVLGFSKEFAVGGAAYNAIGGLTMGDLFADYTLSGTVTKMYEGFGGQAPEWLEAYDKEYKAAGDVQKFLMETLATEGLGLAIGGLFSGVSAFSKSAKAGSVKAAAATVNAIDEAVHPEKKKVAEAYRMIGDMLEGLQKKSENLKDADGLMNYQPKELIEKFVAEFPDSAENITQNMAVKAKKMIDDYNRIEEDIYKYIEENSDVKAYIKDDQGSEILNPEFFGKNSLHVQRVKLITKQVQERLVREINSTVPAEMRAQFIDRLSLMYSDAGVRNLQHDGKKMFTRATATKLAHNYNGRIKKAPNKDMYYVEVSDIDSFGINILDRLSVDRFELNKTNIVNKLANAENAPFGSDVDKITSYVNNKIGKNYIDPDVGFRGVVSDFTPKGVEVFNGKDATIIPWEESIYKKSPFGTKPTDTVDAGPSESLNTNLYFTEDDARGVLGVPEGVGINEYITSTEGYQRLQLKLRDLRILHRQMIQEAKAAAKQNINLFEDGDFFTDLVGVKQQIKLLKNLPDNTNALNTSKKINSTHVDLQQDMDAALGQRVFDTQPKASELAQDSKAEPKPHPSEDTDSVAQEMAEANDGVVAEKVAKEAGDKITGQQAKNDGTAIADDSELKKFDELWQFNEEDYPDDVAVTGVTKPVAESLGLTSKEFETSIKPNNKDQKNLWSVAMDRLSLLGGDTNGSLRKLYKGKVIQRTESDNGELGQIKPNTVYLAQPVKTDAPSPVLAITKENLDMAELATRIVYDTQGGHQVNPYIRYMNGNHLAQLAENFLDVQGMVPMRLVDQNVDGHMRFVYDPDGQYYINSTNAIEVQDMKKYGWAEGSPRKIPFDAIYKDNFDAIYKINSEVLAADNRPGQPGTIEVYVGAKGQVIDKETFKQVDYETFKTKTGAKQPADLNSNVDEYVEGYIEKLGRVVSADEELDGIVSEYGLKKAVATSKREDRLNLEKILDDVFGAGKDRNGAMYMLDDDHQVIIYRSANGSVVRKYVFDGQITESNIQDLPSFKTIQSKDKYKFYRKFIKSEEELKKLKEIDRKIANNDKVNGLSITRKVTPDQHNDRWGTIKKASDILEYGNPTEYDQAVKDLIDHNFSVTTLREAFEHDFGKAQMGLIGMFDNARKAVQKKFKTPKEFMEHIMYSKVEPNRMLEFYPQEAKQMRFKGNDVEIVSLDPKSKTMTYKILGSDQELTHKFRSMPEVNQILASTMLVGGSLQLTDHLIDKENDKLDEIAMQAGMPGSRLLMSIINDGADALMMGLRFTSASQWMLKNGLNKKLQMRLSTLGALNLDDARSIVRSSRPDMFSHLEEGTDGFVALKEALKDKDLIKELVDTNQINKFQAGLLNLRSSATDNIAADFLSQSFDGIQAKLGVYNPKGLRPYLSYLRDLKNTVEYEVVGFEQNFNSKYGSNEARKYMSQWDDDKKQAYARLMEMELNEAGEITHVRDSVMDYYRRNPSAQAYDQQLLADEKFMDLLKSHRDRFNEVNTKYNDLMSSEIARHYNEVKIFPNTYKYNGPGNVDGYLPESLFNDVAGALLNNDVSWSAFIKNLEVENPQLAKAITKVHKNDKNFSKMISLKKLKAANRKIQGYLPNMFDRDKTSGFISSLRKELSSSGKFTTAEIDAQIVNRIENMMRNANKGKAGRFGESMTKNTALKTYREVASKLTGRTRNAFEMYIGKPVTEVTVEDLEAKGLLEPVNVDGKTYYYMSDSNESIKLDAGVDGAVSSKFWDLYQDINYNNIARQMVEGKFTPTVGRSNHLERTRNLDLPHEFKHTSPEDIIGRFSSDVAYRVKNLEYGIHNISDDSDARARFIEPLVQDLRKKLGNTKAFKDASNKVFAVWEMMHYYHGQADPQKYKENMFVNGLREYLYTSYGPVIAAYDLFQPFSTGAMMMGNKNVLYAMKQNLGQTKFNQIKKELFSSRLIDMDLESAINANDIQYRELGKNPHWAKKLYLRMFATSPQGHVKNGLNKAFGVDSTEESLLTNYGRLSMNSMAQAQGSNIVRGAFNDVIDQIRLLKQVDDRGLVEHNGQLISQRSILDKLFDYGLDINPRQKTLDGQASGYSEQIDRLMQYVDVFEERLQSGAPLSDASLNNLRDVLDSVSRTSLNKYMGRDALMRGEKMANRTPTSKIFSTFLSYVTNQRNLIKNNQAAVDGWFGQHAPDDVSFLNVYLAFKRGDYQRLQKLGLSEQAIREFPVKAMDSHASLLKGMPLLAAGRMSMLAAKHWMTMLSLGAVGSIPGIISSKGSEIDSKRKIQRLMKVPTDLENPDALMSFNLADEMPVVENADVMDFASYAFMLGDFMSREYAANGNLGPAYGIMEGIGISGTYEVPLISIYSNKFREIYNLVKESAKPGPTDAKTVFNAGRTVIPTFTNRAQ